MHKPILVVQDIHLCERPPGWRKDSYFRDIASKLVECIALSNKYGAVLVLNGDFFHRKKNSMVSHNTVRVALACLKRAKESVFLVLGNHDILGAQAKQRIHQPVGVILESGFVKLLDRVSWGKFDLVGMHYSEFFERGEVEFCCDDERPSVLFAHGSLNKESGLRTKIKGNVHRCFYGHIHYREGVDGNWVNFGSISRTTRDSYNRRMVSVPLFDFESGVSEIVLSRQKSWEEIYIEELPSVEERQDELTDKDVDEFISSLTMESFTDYKEYILSLDPDVRERVSYYLGSF